MNDNSNTTTASGTIDRADIEATRYRVAICALDYYPAKPEDEPGYTIDEDITWSIAPLLGRDPAALAQLREVIRDTIADPTTHRDALNYLLDALRSTPAGLEGAGE